MDRKGFTLIELLIVVVIIGVLAAIALPKFANTKEKAALGTMKADLRNLASVQEAYFMDSSRYASAIATLQAAPYTYRYSGQNTVVINTGTGSSWSATATNPAAGAITCTVSYNTGATDDGLPICN